MNFETCSDLINIVFYKDYITDNKSSFIPNYLFTVLLLKI